MIKSKTNLTNISATKWKTLGETVATAGQRSYKYSYDKSDKLKTATFQAFNNTTSTWTKEANTLNEQITHDHNGNILSLLRNSATPTAARTAQTMDNLTYTYGYGNRLNKVADTGLPTAGFVDDNNAQAKEYTYDSLGNLLTDKNKNISAIIYNTLGKPQQITYTNGNTVAYTYDAAGSKLKVVSTVGGTATTTDYVGGFVYTNTALTFFSSPEGRVVKNGSNYEYQYAISDHQGNTRVLFTSAAPTTQSVTATFEAANQTAEATQFSNYGHISAINNHTPGGANSQYLNGGYAGMVGVAKSFKVFPGDQLQIEAYGSYNAPGSNSSSLASFAGALLTAFNLTAPAGGETGTASSAINAWGGQEAAGYANGSTDNTNPKAFVNIVLFDKNYNLLDVAYAQLKGTSLYYMTASYTVREIGYAYLYVSNEQLNMTDVYFDDVKVSYTPSRLIQSNEYYPFGLQTANSWTRDGNIANNFLANGGTELNNTTALYDLEFRNYDPALGRMHQVDPMADKYSSFTTYNYAFNSPVMMNDVNGADPNDYYNNLSPPKSWWSRDLAEMSGSGYMNPGAYAQFLYSSAMLSGAGTPEGDPWGMYGSGSNSYYFALAAAESGEQNARAWVSRYTAQHLIENDRVLYGANIEGKHYFFQLDKEGNAYVPYTFQRIDPKKEFESVIPGFWGSQWNALKATGMALLDGGQFALDIVGLVPGAGELADGANALIYTARGDYVNAGLSTAGMVPFVGWGATGGKLLRKAIRYSDEVTAISKQRWAHIMKDDHLWKKVFANPTQDKVSQLVKATMEYGTNLSYKGGTSKMMYYNGFQIQVTYKEIEGKKLISDAWVYISK